ncbi:MAG: TetR/AcrR family transcriptional regulator [Xanthobacteraceae bacterium]|nr:TetR/AcrR family transcriptional regulator [Xanthobacteraceae bacterium]
MPRQKSNETDSALFGLGLRARGKRERRQRLREAARQVFLERGYEGATTREIAARAELAIGTLFAYATEKRDLLYLIFNDDLDVMVDTAIRETTPQEPVIDQLLGVFRPVYKYFERHATIGRYGVHEMFLLQAEQPEMLGPEAKRVVERRERISRALAEIIDRSKKAGRLSTPEPGHAIAQLLFWVHWCNVQSWLSTKSPSAEIGFKKLRRAFLTVVNGLGPSPKA